MKLATEKLLLILFFSHIEKRGDCWLWTGRLDQGYPTIQVRYKRLRVARTIYELILGPIPDQRTMERHCNSLCVRPQHAIFGRPHSITDEFTPLPVSRERKRQLRKLKAGLCQHVSCTLSLQTSAYCKQHAIESRERARKKLGSVRRNNSLTYRL